MDKLVIDRGKWLRGEGSDESYLLRSSDGKMCCLGFDALRRGFSANQLFYIASPIEFQIPIAGLVVTGEGGLTPTKTCTDLTYYNDWKGLSERTREQGIADLFASIGVDVEFVN